MTNQTATDTPSPVDLVLMSLDHRIEAAQADFLRHARWAVEDLENQILNAKRGNTPSVHIQSNVHSMEEAATTVRLLAEARNTIRWAADQDEGE